MPWKECSVMDVELPPCGKTALEIVNAIRANKDSRGRSAAGLAGPVFPETGAKASALRPTHNTARFLWVGLQPDVFRPIEGMASA